jgi:hypothetical protein
MAWRRDHAQMWEIVSMTTITLAYHWAEVFEEAGYTALTPGWPDDPVRTPARCTDPGSLYRHSRPCFTGTLDLASALSPRWRGNVGQTPVPPLTTRSRNQAYQSIGQPRGAKTQPKKGNMKGTSLRQRATTYGHSSSADSFCFRDFRPRRGPRFPSLPSPDFHGKEEALGSNPREGLGFRTPRIRSTTSIARSFVATLDSVSDPLSVGRWSEPSNQRASRPCHRPWDQLVTRWPVGTRPVRPRAQRPSRRAAFSFRMSGRTSSLKSACSKSASQRSGVIIG